MLIAPALLDEFYPELRELDRRSYDRLRSSWLAAEVARPADAQEARRAFVAMLLEGSLALEGWQKATAVGDEFKATSVAGERLRPSWALPAPDGVAPIVLQFDEADRLGVGRSRRSHARLVELMRRTGVPLGVLTNGRQLRLVHAGPDYDAWAEWDAATWFDESEGRESLRGLHALLGAHDGAVEGVTARLAGAIRASRDRQGDLAQVLGEQVRRAVELLVTEVDGELERDADLQRVVWTDPATGETLDDDEAHAALFQAATRIVMRLVLILYAESRDLLPASVEAYHESYGVEGLYRVLAEADRDGADGAPGSAWARVLALFRLVHDGSPHPDLPVRAYGGQLFRPGDFASPDVVLRALATFERTRPGDPTVYRLLRLLKVGRIKVRAGRSSRWVAGPVDFSDLRTEYIGIVYEGLLDYELRRAPADDPIVFLNVGRQPALPLSRLEGLSAADRKKLLETFKKDTGSAVETEGDENVEAALEEETEADEPVEDATDDTDEPDAVVLEDDAAAHDEDAIVVVHRWARDAVVDAGRVRRPRSRTADVSEFERRVDGEAKKLIAAIVPPGRLYLVASGGLRKGSGSFYTRPALAVPLVQRTLEPLCYVREGDVFLPKTPEAILSLKICEPAMGSGSFLVGALRYLVEALVASFEHHGRIQRRAERETVVTLPFGVGAAGEENEEVFDLPPEDERFLERLRPRLARHVVERCLYGVDLNPMAVELARLALWVETLDRDLPFEYLDHKLKPGNSLVGCWLHLVDDYPLRSLDREGGDGQKGERTKWLKAKFAQAKQEMPDVIRAMGGALTLFEGLTLPAEDVVARVRERFEKLHDLPQELREDAYRELLASVEYRTLKRRMDLWCSLWFWPPGDESLPTPRTWSELDDAASKTLDRLVADQPFFHWEIEFPDVFGPQRAGFDAVLGNPPWETVQAESNEFFSRHDPLYRTYNKTTALDVQRHLFAAEPQIERDWDAYTSSFKSFTNFVKASSDPFDASLGRGRTAVALTAAWARERSRRPNLADREHPFRLQGAGKTYTYKLFLESSHHLLRDGGRLGMLVPSGVYTDAGSSAIRKHFVDACRWEWAYFFENRQRIFPIHGSYKYGPVVLQRGGPTEAINAAFMRHDVGEWERPWEHTVRLSVNDIKRFAPNTWSFMELKGDRDLDIVNRLYGDHALLADWLRIAGGVYSQEFNMTSDDKFFVGRSKLEELELLRREDDARDPRARAHLRVAGYVPLYEGKSFYLHNPYFAGKGTTDGVSRAVRLADAETELGDRAWKRPRLIFRDIARTTDQRTLVPALMPPAVHGNKAPSLNDLPDPALLGAVLGSLTVDYIVRMKVSATINWFYAETIPIPNWDGTPFATSAGELVLGLNAIGQEFPTCAKRLRVEGGERMTARLILDALVAHIYRLHPADLEHIAAQFPVYDKGAPADLRYPRLAVDVFCAMHEDGPEAAERRASELVEQRRKVGCGFGLDELWQPEDGWEQANREARKILEEAGLR
jgi:hypothetical protein